MFMQIVLVINPIFGFFSHLTSRDECRARIGNNFKIYIFKKIYFFSSKCVKFQMIHRCRSI